MCSVRRKHHSSSTQPLDRHLSEIDKFDGTIYINAGIDSTCCKKRGQILHKLTDGIVVVSTVIPPIKSTRSSNEHHDDLFNDRCDSLTNVCCRHCGK